jgi:superfamily II DNA or RNA helicase
MSETTVNYVLPDDLNFNEYINNAFSRYKLEKTTKIKSCDEIAADRKNEEYKSELFSYQKLLQEYMAPDSPYRGVLVYHQLGSGKTLTAVGVAENQDRPVIIMLPSSLKMAWFEEIMNFRGYKIPKKATETERKKLMKEFEDKIKEKYTFISSNASNSAEQLEFMEERKLGQMKTAEFEDIDYIVERIEEEANKKVKKSKVNPLDGKFLIIDESHRIMTNIINAESKNGLRIYDTIMDAKDLRVMALTATPLIGNPYESAVLFNILRGYMTVEGSNQKFTAFPKEYDQFMEYFVDLDNSTIKNKHIYQERINGLVSYYRGLYDPKNEVIPRENKVSIVSVEMSDYQWKTYAYFRKEELEEEKKSKFATEKFVKLEYKKPGRKSFTTYRMKTRQLCNFVLPKDIKRPKYKKSDIQSLRKKIDNQLIEQIPVEIVTKKLGQYSPKMKKILDTLASTKTGIAFVYSNFITLGGLGVLAYVLKHNGYMMYTGKESPSTFEVPQDKEYKVFALLTGETQSNYYQNVLKFLNDPKNKDGKYCRALLASSVVAEGINLKNVRQVHIMEPDWRQTRLDQVVGRAFRLCSHNDLPQKERYVDIYIYLMRAPAGLAPSKTLGEETDFSTDEYIYDRAQENKKLLDKFLVTIKEIAFDCELNAAHNFKKGDIDHCTKCADPQKYDGKNKKVYLPNITQHIIPGNSYCLPKRETAKLMPISIDNKQYFIDSSKNVYECDAKKVCQPVGKMVHNKLQITIKKN